MKNNHRKTYLKFKPKEIKDEIQTLQDGVMDNAYRPLFVENTT